jgi:hypothetical protein
MTKTCPVPILSERENISATVVLASECDLKLSMSYHISGKKLILIFYFANDPNSILILVSAAITNIPMLERLLHR